MCLVRVDIIKYLGWFSFHPVLIEVNVSEEKQHISNDNQTDNGLVYGTALC